MTLGLPTPMFLIFVATVLAGSLGALHYLVVHIVGGKSFGDDSQTNAKSHD